MVWESGVTVRDELNFWRLFVVGVDNCVRMPVQMSAGRQKTNKLYFALHIQSLWINQLTFVLSLPDTNNRDK